MCNKLDYSRLLSYDEITNISNAEYQTIITYCSVCHKKYQAKWNNDGIKVRRKKGNYFYQTKTNAPGGSYNGNTMDDANYFKNCKHFMIQNIDEKHRELILTNYTAHNTELFIKVLNQGLPKTQFDNIEQIFETIQNLIYLYNNNSKKFLFMKTALKLEDKLIPIFNLFEEYYEITDPVIIINKITEIFAKEPEFLENNKIYTKK